MKRRNFFKGLLGSLGLLVIPVARTAVAREEIGSNPTQPSKEKWPVHTYNTSKEKLQKKYPAIEKVYGPPLPKDIYRLKKSDEELLKRLAGQIERAL